MADTEVVVVVSPNRLVLFRSEIFGGLSNEISVLLDQSTLANDLEGMEWWLLGVVCWTNFFEMQRKATSTSCRRIQMRSLYWEIVRTTSRDTRNYWA